MTAAERAGVGFLSFSRAGYGRSTRNPGRSVASVAEDVRQLSTRLGIDEIVADVVALGRP